MTFWIHDYMVLVDKNQFYVWPTEDMTSNDKLNAISRAVIILSVLGVLCTYDTKFIWIGLFTLACIVIYERTLQAPPETFTQFRSNHTTPTPKNPLMNVLLPEINGNPNRKPALPSFNQETEKEINDSVKKMLPDARIYKGTKNEMDLEYSMRNFYTTASTTIPNDQEGFSKFCYGDLISAKEGDPLALDRNSPRLGSVG